MSCTPQRRQEVAPPPLGWLFLGGLPTPAKPRSVASLLEDPGVSALPYKVGCGEAGAGPRRSLLFPVGVSGCSRPPILRGFGPPGPSVRAGRGLLLALGPAFPSQSRRLSSTLTLGSILCASASLHTWRSSSCFHRGSGVSASLTPPSVWLRVPQLPTPDSLFGLGLQVQGLIWRKTTPLSLLACGTDLSEHRTRSQ